MMISANTTKSLSHPRTMNSSVTFTVLQAIQRTMEDSIPIMVTQLHSLMRVSLNRCHFSWPKKTLSTKIYYYPKKGITKMTLISWNNPIRISWLVSKSPRVLEEPRNNRTQQLPKRPYQRLAYIPLLIWRPPQWMKTNQARCLKSRHQKLKLNSFSLIM